jgi:hypothetical protein
MGCQGIRVPRGDTGQRDYCFQAWCDYGVLGVRAVGPCHAEDTVAGAEIARNRHPARQRLANFEIPDTESADPIRVNVSQPSPGGIRCFLRRCANLHSIQYPADE